MNIINNCSQKLFQSETKINQSNKFINGRIRTHQIVTALIRYRYLLLLAHVSLSYKILCVKHKKEEQEKAEIERVRFRQIRMIRLATLIRNISYGFAVDSLFL